MITSTGLNSSISIIPSNGTMLTKEFCGYFATASTLHVIIGLVGVILNSVILHRIFKHGMIKTYPVLLTNIVIADIVLGLAYIFRAVLQALSICNAITVRCIWKKMPILMAITLILFSTLALASTRPILLISPFMSNRAKRVHNTVFIALTYIVVVIFVILGFVYDTGFSEFTVCHSAKIFDKQYFFALKSTWLVCVIIVLLFCSTFAVGIKIERGSIDRQLGVSVLRDNSRRSLLILLLMAACCIFWVIEFSSDYMLLTYSHLAEKWKYLIGYCLWATFPSLAVVNGSVLLAGDSVRIWRQTVRPRLSHQIWPLTRTSITTDVL